MIRVTTSVALGVSLAALAAADPGSSIAITAEQREALGIVVGTPEARDLVPRSPLPGRITLPNDRVRLVTARSEGVLFAPVVAVGDLVTTGQAMARLESPAFVSLQREYLEALSQLDLARSTAERERQLADEGIIPGRRAAQSTTRLSEARARLEERRQSLMLAGMSEEEFASLRETRRLEVNLVLRAPFSGVVLEQYAEPGERLEAGAPVYRIGDLAALTVEIHTPLELALAVREGTRFRLPDESASGRVVAVGRQVHALDQGVLVRGEIDLGASALRPGQFVRVQFETPRDQGTAWAIPAKAVVHAAGRPWIFREIDGGFKPVAVEVVGGSGGKTVIVAPLSADTHIAVRGTAALKAHWLNGPEP